MESSLKAALAAADFASNKEDSGPTGAGWTGAVSLGGGK